MDNLYSIIDKREKDYLLDKIYLDKINNDIKRVEKLFQDNPVRKSFAVVVEDNDGKVFGRITYCVVENRLLFVGDYCRPLIETKINIRLNCHKFLGLLIEESYKV
jgi:hypothetical protein